MTKASDFFDAQHGDALLPLPLHYRMLRRFEVTREEVAAALLPGGDALLDIGCGDGELALRASDGYRRVVASDISPAVVRQARERRGTVAEWMVLDASRPLPFADASFSTVVSLSTLQYLFDPQAFFLRATRT